MRALLAALLVLAAPAAIAAGFAIPEQTARAMGLGGNGVSNIDGAANVYYNPGQLGFLDGLAAELGGNLIIPTFGYEPLTPGAGTPVSVESRTFLLPTVFGSAVVADRFVVGVGAFANFGLGITWPDDFAGRFDTISAEITPYTVNATLAYRVSEWLGVGAGVDVVRATVELEQAINLIDSEGRLHVGGGAWGAGFNVGLAGRFMQERLRVGLAYRSAVPLTFSGNADFSGPPELETQLRDQTARTRIDLPQLIFLGARYEVSSRVALMGQLDYNMWRSFTALELDFEDDALDRSLPRNWGDSFCARLGGEFRVGEALMLRAGGGYDQTPSPSDTLSPSLPDGNRIFGTLGIGYRLGNFYADAGYLFLWVLSRDTTGDAFPAHYTGTAHLAMLSVGFRQ